MIYKLLNNFHKLLYVCKMKTCRRFIHNVKCLSCRNSSQFVGKLNTLSFSTRKSKRALPQLNISQTNRFKSFQLSRNVRNGNKEIAGFLNSHIKDIVYAFSFVKYIQGFAVKTFSVTNITGNENIRQKVHLNCNCSATLTVFTAAALYVKTESSLCVTVCL